ncbi:MAG: cation-translocating P-type ATPase, partial [Promethearchaeota archaeon]
ICSDKTGTLTENQMTVTKVFYNSTVYDVSGIGYFPEGEIQLNGQKINPLTDVFFWNMLINGAVNNNTEFSTETVKLKKGTQDIIKILGLPTEGALLTLAQKAGINPKLEQRNYQVVKELSFSSQRKRMTKIVRRDGNLLCFTKGAPEKILEICTQIIQNGEVVELDSALRQQIGDQITSFAMSGLRTLALGFKNLQNSDNISQMTPDQIEQDLIFTGMVGMLDPPQEGVKESIEICKNAGIKVVMITGDHPTTATSIAKAVNIYQDGDGVASGSEIQGMNVDQITQTSVFARVGPEDKLNIVKAFQAKDYIVAMTGDGVNDALALENADVGIAMGLKGTDVAKNAADIVITDDSFNTIETALYHGRGLFNNIRSNIVFLLVCNLMEITVLVTIYLVTGAEIFTAFHLIILYATIHFFPPFGLMFDKYDPFIMKDPPKKVNEPLINRTYLKMMFLQILVVAGVLIGVWWLVMSGTVEISLINMENPLSINPFNGGDVFGYVNPGLDPWLFENGDHPEILKLFKAQTMCFCTLIISEVWISLESRSTKTGIFKAQFNIALTILILIVFGILAAITQYDLFQSFMHIINLSLFDWGVILGASFIVIILTEIWKKL